MSKNIGEMMKSFEEYEANMSRMDKTLRWYYCSIWNPISNFWYGLKHLPGNIKRWWSIVWGYRAWDYTYTLKALRVGLEGQLKQFEYANSERGWAYVGIEKDIHKIKVCINLIDRIVKDDYCLIEYKVFKNSKFKYERIHWTEKNDIEYLMNTMKNIRQWWD